MIIKTLKEMFNACFYSVAEPERIQEPATSGVVSPTSTTPSSGSTPPLARAANTPSPTPAASSTTNLTQTSSGHANTPNSNANAIASIKTALLGMSPIIGPSYPLIPCPSFDWDLYLRETNSIAAPPECFQQVSFPLFGVYLC